MNDTTVDWLAYLACGLGGGRRHGGPHVSVGVSLLDDVVRDVNATTVQRRLPGDYHVLPVHLLKHYWPNWRSWTVCKKGCNNGSVKKKSQNNESLKL